MKIELEHICMTITTWQPWILIFTKEQTKYTILKFQGNLEIIYSVIVFAH